MNTMDEASKIGNIFVTTTGRLINGDDFEKMVDNAFVINLGEIGCEVDVSYLDKNAMVKEKLSSQVDRYELKSGRHVIMLAGGRKLHVATEKAQEQRGAPQTTVFQSEPVEAGGTPADDDSNMGGGPIVDRTASDYLFDMGGTDETTRDPNEITSPPLLDLPEGSFDLTAFKHMLITLDAAEAIGHLWLALDAENYSLWTGRYKQKLSFTKGESGDFLMAMFERFRGSNVRELALGCLCLIGADDDCTISSVWVCRGKSIQAVLSQDCLMDYEGFEWEKLKMCEVAKDRFLAHFTKSAIDGKSCFDSIIVK